LIIVLGLLASGAFAMVAPTEAEGAGEIRITDTLNREIILSGPVDHIVTMGVGFTTTVIDLGCKDKIVGVDPYSTEDYTGDSNFSGLESLGSIYSASAGQIMYTTLLQLRDQGKFTENDVIVVPSTYSGIIDSSVGLLAILDKIGSAKINVLALAAETYEGVIEAVEAVAKALGKESDSMVTDMRDLKTYVEDKVESENLVGGAGIHISSAGKVYNRSILVSFIDIAGGVNAGSNGSNDLSYATDKAALLQMSQVNQNTTIFLDSGHSLTASEFKNENNLTCNVVKVNAKWNNVSPSVTDGLWFVAMCMYPEAFEGDMPDFGEETPDNTLLYIGAGAIVAVLICVIAVVYLRKS